MGTKFRLACGHKTLRLTDEQMLTVGEEVRCSSCEKAAYQALLAARPATDAERYATREEVLTAHPGAQWHEYGPVLKYGDVFRVQTYLGQHEWLAVNVADVRDVLADAGWEGDVFGYAFVADEHISHALDVDRKLASTEPPVRSAGKPITGDALLFGDTAKLQAYLGPDDPSCPK